MLVAAPTKIAPISGLFEDCLQTTARAYARRAPVLNNPERTLRSLKPIDSRLRQLGDSARYYGPYALRAAQRDHADTAIREGGSAVFNWLTCALSLERPASEILSLLDSIAPEHSMAARDALWFAAEVPGPPLLRELLRSQDEDFVQLGIELSGLLTQSRLAPDLAALTHHPRLGSAALLSLVRSGLLPPGFEADITSRLNSGDALQQRHALQTIAVSGQPVAPDLVGEQAHLLLQGRSTDLESGAGALALATIWNPLQTLQTLVQGRHELGDLAYRCVALVGTVEGLLWACKKMAQQDQAPRCAQLDVLQTILGLVPMELRERPGDGPARATALRQAVHGFLVHNGCAGLTPLDLANWDTDVLRGNAWPIGETRFRAGRPWRAGELLLPAADVSHGLRSWLYAELAFTHQRPTALHAHDLAARQLQAMEALAMVDELAA